MTDRHQIVREYFTRVDAGQPNVLELFTEDAKIFFPKFGIGHGQEGFGALVQGLLSAVASISHPQEKMTVSGTDVVVAEGISQGELKDGITWYGGDTPGGRFCSVFEFSGDLISRMFIYTDPDYGGQDADRFLWGKGADRQW